VIVAQADSTQALPDGEIERIRAAMANIAATARRSLGDVRAVLSDDPSAQASRQSDLESLVEGVRAAGNEVAFEVEGTPRPLPPELDAIAYRTLQELLTNALKHGVGAIDVTLSWTPDELGIAVANPAADEPGPGGGTGLAGMRERLEAAGGSLAAGLAGDRWIADARMPVRREGMTE
jgi:signal transduction histidine kinase